MNTKKIRKRKGFYFCLLAFPSVLLLLLLSVVSLFWPTRRFSASERRNLAQRPKLSYEGIVDGTFSGKKYRPCGVDLSPFQVNGGTRTVARKIFTD